MKIIHMNIHFLLGFLFEITRKSKIIRDRDYETNIACVILIGRQ
jgi:hypothetical protein